MKCTSIKFKNGSKVGSLEALCWDLHNALTANGFKTEVEVKNSTSIKIGMHMSSFRIITSELGYNGRISRFCKSPKGYKRTDVPTWDQRVEFNDIVNAKFDEHGLSATIKSGCYSIRKGTHSFNESDWQDQTPTNRGYAFEPDQIHSEEECRDIMDSDTREAEHKAKQKAERQTTKATAKRSPKLTLIYNAG
jgi:hypothetical protein